MNERDRTSGESGTPAVAAGPGAVLEYGGRRGGGTGAWSGRRLLAVAAAGVIVVGCWAAAPSIPWMALGDFAAERVRASEWMEMCWFAAGIALVAWGVLPGSWVRVALIAVLLCGLGMWSIG